MKNAQTIAAMLLAAAGLLACGPQGQTGKADGTAKTQKKTGEVLATIGDETLTVDEVKARMEEQSPFIRARYDSPERKREFVDNLVRFELLAQEAKRRGFADDPEVLSAMKKTMVQKLMRAEFDDNGKAPPVSEQELRAFYDENINDFVKPERVRLSHVFFAAAKGDASRMKVKADATKALAAVKAKDATDKSAFADLAKTRSDDDASKRAGGDLSFKTREELDAAWGPELTAAAFDLKEIGQLGSVIETDKGYHVVKLTGRQNPLDRPFDTVKAQIEGRLSREKRTKAFDTFVEDLKSQAKVTVNDDLLAQIEVNTGGMPAGMPGGMGMPAGMPGGMQGMPAGHPMPGGQVGGNVQPAIAIQPSGKPAAPQPAAVNAVKAPAPAPAPAKVAPKAPAPAPAR
ncbi:peptidylprolyl isomerase [Vulgatibacter incomptus]|uniref:Peptidyl-prolyl cis-trans isomerase PpiD n=1 Tax=Vulgatibacter incomptus TaxID=1391653 RepID=A0A0K1PHD4_9BACT|nr:peptidyl-prolyl cis-trans isomerase [Vulgatibacter incomptus]AKU92930.1 Peptidyl-prolyl cis-trans isomerase PpiD [Vulgatibacter incomptus]